MLCGKDSISAFLHLSSDDTNKLSNYTKYLQEIKTAWSDLTDVLKLEDSETLIEH